MITDFISQFSNAELILVLFFLLTFFVQVFFYLRFYSLTIFHKNKKPSTTESFPPVTIIISAKNEAYNLPEFLPHILEQDYPEFQVVVVDDCSEDDTWDVLERYKREYPHLYNTRIHFDPVFKHGKKMALSLGVKAAKHDILLFTDADCKPAGNQWLKFMVQNYSGKVDIVLGYSPVVKTKGILNHIIRFDNIFTAVQYIGSALAKRAYMGVGRNLSYKKTLFLENKGFAPHVQLMSGDDDLFVNKVATKTNTAIEISPEALVNTQGKSTWKDWVIQKRRHLTTGSYYRFSDKWRLGLELVSRFFFYASFVTALILLKNTWLILAIFGFRFIIQGLVINLTARKLKQPGFIFTFWILDIILPLLNAWFVFKNATNPKGVKWK